MITTISPTPPKSDLLEPVPYGYCHCRCAELAPLAPVNYAERGWVKGEPLKYIHGHRARLPHATGPRADAFQKFWMKALPVDGPLPTPCFIWQGGLWSNGYAKVSISGRTRLGHRLAYELANATRLTTDQVVAHHCDHRACINPTHLFLTDAKGNAMDSASKGRARKVLVAGQVMEMRELHAAGWSLTALAKHFAVNASTVKRIVTGQAWRHLAAGWTPAPSRLTSSGERHHSAKLNPAKVQEIRRRRQAGELLVALAEAFGVSVQTIHAIVTSQTWRHVDTEAA
jgi:plasmid maintenance system antidote protein VapI